MTDEKAIRDYVREMDNEIEANLIDCPDCNGTGQIDRSEHLDLGDREQVLKELVDVVTSDGPVSPRSADRADRLQSLGRIGFLAGRLVWLESIKQRSEELQARSEQVQAERADAVEWFNREMAFLTNDKLFRGDATIDAGLEKIFGRRLADVDDHLTGVHTDQIKAGAAYIAERRGTAAS